MEGEGCKISLYRLGYMSSIAHANVASSADVERLFSTAGKIVTRERESGHKA